MEEIMEIQHVYRVSFVQPDESGNYREYKVLVYADNEEDAKRIAKIDNPNAEEMIAIIYCYS